MTTKIFESLIDHLLGRLGKIEEAAHALLAHPECKKVLAELRRALYEAMHKSNDPQDSDAE